MSRSLGTEPGVVQERMATTVEQAEAGPSYVPQETANAEPAIASPESSTASEGRYELWLTVWHSYQLAAIRLAQHMLP